MSRRRLIPLVVAVVALVAVVAVAALGRPLSAGGGGGGGLTTTFWNYAFTTLFVVEILALAGGVWVLWTLRPDVGDRKYSGGRTMRALAILLTAVTVLFYVELHFVRRHALPTNVPSAHEPAGGGPQTGLSAKKHARPVARLQWGELAVVLAALTAVGAVYVVRRKRLGPGSRPRRLGPAPETVAAALDESLDDLRSDPDLRRAIVAAYARMERALAAVGVPRHPAEAPLEYLERVLLSLDASAGAVRRLTDLFEWARFSQHEPEPAMRDEAVDALVAVRDELRAGEPVGTW